MPSVKWTWEGDRAFSPQERFFVERYISGHVGALIEKGNEQIISGLKKIDENIAKLSDVMKGQYRDFYHAYKMNIHPDSYWQPIKQNSITMQKLLFAREQLKKSFLGNRVFDVTCDVDYPMATVRIRVEVSGFKLRQ